MSDIVQSVPAIGNSQPGPRHVPITWQGKPWGLAGLSLFNFVLTIATIGIYGFWGRTEVRKRIWSFIRLDGEPLAYTGTGKELFLGFLLVFGLILVPSILLSLAIIVALGPASGVAAATQFGFYVLFFYLVGVATYRARRYRLSRTRWRGIRGAMEGNSWAFGWTYFWSAVVMFAVFILLFIALSLLGMGTVPAGAEGLRIPIWVTAPLLLLGVVAAVLVAPWRTTLLTRRLTNDTQFGNRPFSFNGTAQPLYARFLARWIGVIILAIATLVAMYFWIGPQRLATIMTPDGGGVRRGQLSGREVVGILGILFIAALLFSVITAWYKAAEANYFASVTSFEGVPFKLTISAGGLIALVVTNFLIVTLSLGILRPVAQARTARYMIDNLSLTGPIDVAKIAQSQAELSKTGEGLAQAFDVDAF
jgi:uncharacterized membrane protein YjgN (DUF898 family)